MRFVLRITTGKLAGREIPVQGPRFIIGSAESCHLKINAVHVSPCHCALHIQDDAIWLRDYGGGVLVGGTRIVDRCPLNHGDQLQIGSLQFELLIEDAKVKANGRLPDDREILDILSQPVEHAVAAVSGPSVDAQSAKDAEGGDSGDAASDILNKVFMYKGAFKANMHADGAIMSASQPSPEVDVKEPLPVGPIEAVEGGASATARKRRVIALPKWFFEADGRISSNVMFALGVWVGIGLCSAAIALTRVFSD
jgi:predicted component of type VI protein secretion system